MKNAVWLVIGLLLLWNIFLSISLSDIQDRQVSDDNQQVLVENTVNGYITDLTKVIEGTDSQVVTVETTVNDNNYYGSGFVYDYQDDVAYIVTNYHVVENVQGINVRFDNGVETYAEVYGYDEYYDIAVLRVPVDFRVDTVKLGDSSILKKGEFVIAIGSPVSDDFEGSVSVGVVGGLNRMISVDVDGSGSADFKVSAIQTDADLNAGNSGGPLINMAGEVVGINTAAMEPGTVGMNFAIEINEVKTILQSIMNEDEIYHPVIDFESKDIDNLSNYQKSFYGIQLDQLYGIYVDHVDFDSDYARAGLQSGDIIVSLNDMQISNIVEFRTELFKLQQGTTVAIGIIRDNEPVTLAMVLE